MKKKILKISLIIAFTTSVLFIALCFYILFNLSTALTSNFTNANSTLLKSMQNDIANHQTRSLNKLKEKFLSDSIEKIDKDSETLSSLINDYSIIGVRDFINTIFQNDQDIISASVITKNEEGYTIWAHFNKDLPLGIGYDNSYDSKTNTWTSKKGNKTSKYKIDFKNDSGMYQNQKIVRYDDSFTIIDPIKVNDQKARAVIVYQFSLKNIKVQIEKEKELYNKIINNIEKSSKDIINGISENKLKYIEIAIFVIIVVVFIISILNVILARRFGNTITRPINSLLDTMEKVGQGQFELHQVVNTNDEIEQISHNFNHMIEGIRDRDQKLHEYQNNLEEILEQRTQELENERAIKIQESKLKSIGEMSAGIAHEINNPLAVIKPNIAVIRKIMKKEEITSERIDKKLNTIDEMTIRIAEIIKGMTLFSRDQKTIKKEFFEIREVITLSLNLIQQKAKNHNIKIIQQFDDLSAQVYGKKVQLSQVLINLLNNAYYEVDKCEDENERWIKIAVIESEIRIYNGGPKIDSEIVDKIMSPFFSTKPEGLGTGLGLSVSMGIMNSHEGNLSVDLNEENTCFVMSLPSSESKIGNTGS